MAVAALALGGGPGCLLEQDLGHDEPQATMDLALEVDLASPPAPDLASPPDLARRPDHALVPDLACPNDQIFCDGQCRNLNNDPQRCGTCGNRCAAGSICAMGHCEPCPKEQSVCENHCFTLATDVNNCGACANKCAPGKPCVGGMCAR